MEQNKKNPTTSIDKKTVIISYSYTGNNEKLATKLAEVIQVPHIRIFDPQPRKMKKIIGDMMFNRKPEITLKQAALPQADRYIIISPVWMGHIAAPVRTFISNNKQHLKNYIFASISGGALGPNKKIEKELKKRVGNPPIKVIDQYIKDLLGDSYKEKIKMQDTSDYQITDQDATQLVDEILKKI